MSRYSQPGDEKLVVQFINLAVKNETRSVLEGRPCYDDVEHCTVRAPASRNTHGIPYPAASRSHWANDEVTGEQFEVTYMERFPRQYSQFKAQQQQTIHGTPLDFAPWLREGRRAELRSVGVFTIEQLASLDGVELKTIGVFGREDKNRAMEYLESAKSRAPDMKLAAENESLRAQLDALRQDNASLRVAAASRSGEEQFADMSDEQLADYIKANSGGQEVRGTLPRRSLLQMAVELAPTHRAA